MPIRVLTVDLEDWFHLLDHPATAQPSSWTRFASRIEGNTERLLELFARHRVRATFFSLGWVARTYPALLRRIADAGHEIGSHSDVHSLVSRQRPDDFRAETSRSIGAIENAVGAKVRYYRAPGFSITAASTWALGVLAELGIEADLSLFPAARAHGGFPRGSLVGPTLLVLGDHTLRELPMTVAGVGPVQLAYAGGGYFRLLPFPVIRAACLRSAYVMTYFHPRDFDAGQPVLAGLSVVRRFKSYNGLGGALGKLDALLRAFDFVDVRTAMRRVDWEKVPRLALAVPPP
jgi:polysaccharide deacetylase family protein (PEP-CTERM system associated)